MNEFMYIYTVYSTNTDIYIYIYTVYGRKGLTFEKSNNFLLILI